jgi:hypothetical protein
MKMSQGNSMTKEKSLQAMVLKQIATCTCKKNPYRKIIMDPNQL